MYVRINGVTYVLYFIDLSYFMDYLSDIYPFF